MMRLDETNTLAPFPCLYLFSIKSYWQKCTVTSWRHKVTSDDLSMEKWCNIAPVAPSIAYLVMILDDLSRSDAYKRYLFFSPLTYNGEVTKLTWPQVDDIKNPKYTNRRHLCPYCTMRVSKSSDHWCALGTMSNFEKRNMRSGHLIRPGHVTFGVSGSSFLEMCQIVGWTAMANLPPFSRYLRKTLRGVEINPPPPHRCEG